MKTVKKAQAGASMPKKPAPKKPMAPAPKKKKSYPILSDDGENYNGPKVGPREKTPGGGFSRNGSKLKKAKQGDSVAKRDTIRTEYNKDQKLAEVTTFPTFGQDFKSNVRKWMSTDSTDYQNTKAKTKAGKIVRGANKAGSVAARVIGAPVTTTLSAVDAGVKAARNAAKSKKEMEGIKKNGGKVAKMAKKVAPKMMMKKMSKKK